MTKYKFDQDNVSQEEAVSLIEAVARYASVNEYPNVKDIFAILGIVKDETNVAIRKEPSNDSGV